MISRKIMAAAISGTIFAGVFPFLYPEGIIEKNTNLLIFHYFDHMAFHMVFSFPVILFYGTVASILSDFIAKIITKKSANEDREMQISLMLHILFGLIFLSMSLVAVLLFFITDRLLLKKKTYKIEETILWLFLPVITWTVAMLVLRIYNIFSV